jgi:hypothetical protein
MVPSNKVTWPLRGYLRCALAQRRFRKIRPNGAFSREVTLRNVSLSDLRSRDTFGVPLGVRMRNWKLRKIWPRCPFDRKCHFGCYPGRLRPISSMATGISPFTGYLPLLFSYNIIYFDNGFHLRCFRIGCVVPQVVYHLSIAFWLYFQRSWRFLITSSNFRV